MATCFIKVKNNAELDMHVAKYDKKIIAKFAFFYLKGELSIDVPCDQAEHFDR